MSCTYSWSFDAIPSNIDGIPVGWGTKMWTCFGGAYLAPFCISRHTVCDCCKDGILDLSVRTPISLSEIPAKVKIRWPKDDCYQEIRGGSCILWKFTMT